MPLDTYANIKVVIEGHMDNPEAEAKVDDFIDLAETRHKSEIRIREMLVREEVAVFDRYLDLPEKFLEAKNFRLIISGGVAELQEVSPHELNRWRTDDKVRPKRFAVHEQIELDSIPDQNYVGELIFYKELTPLDATNTVNALLTRAPDCYLYAALVASAPFIMHDERVPTWENFYTTARNNVNGTSTTKKRSGPLISRVSGPTP